MSNLGACMLDKPVFSFHVDWAEDVFVRGSRFRKRVVRLPVVCFLQYNRQIYLEFLIPFYCECDYGT